MISLPFDSFTEWMTFLGFAIVGGVYMYSRFKTGTDGQEDRVISLLKEELSLIKAKLTEQDTRIKVLSGSLDKFKAENTLMKQVLEDRDADSIRYRDAGYRAMEIVAAVNTEVLSLKKEIRDLYSLIERHLEVLEGGELNAKSVN